MTACVNRKHTKKVAAVVTASLVGALSLGAAPVAAMAEDTGIDMQAATWVTGATITAAHDGLGGTVSNPNQATFAEGSGKYLVPTEVTNSFGDVTEIDGDFTLTYTCDDDATFNVAVNAEDLDDATDAFETASAGTYRVTVSNSKGSKAFVFKIGSDQSLEGAYAYIGTNTANTTITFDGSNYASKVKFADAEGNDITSDVTVTGWTKADGSTITAADVVDAGTYFATVEDADGNESNVKVVINALDLSASAVTFADTTGVSGYFVDGMLVNGNPLTDATDWVAVTNVQDPDGGASWTAKGEYTVTVSAVSGQSNVKGSATVTFSNLDMDIFSGSTPAKVYYGRDPLPSSGLNIWLEDGESFDASKISVKYGTTTYSGDQLELTFSKGGEKVDASDLANKGSYSVHVRVKPYQDFASENWIGGSTDCDIDVNGTKLNANTNLAFYVDGELAGANEKASYTGEDYLSSITAVVKSGSTVYEQGKDYTLEVKKDGKVVDSIVDKGVYTVTVKPETFDFASGSGTDYFTFEVTAVSINQLVADVDNMKYDADETTGELENVDVTVTNPSTGATTTLPNQANEFYVAYTGSAVEIPGVLYGVEDSSTGKWTYKELSSDLYNVVSIKDKDGKAVKEAVEEGTYTVKVALSDAAKENYQLPSAESTFKFTIKKFGHFTDVDATKWYAVPVEQAAKLGYVNGISGTTLFAPEADITRADAICILFNMAGGFNLPDDDFSFDVDHGYNTGFSDVDGHDYFAKALAWARAFGVANGYGDGTFKPYAQITREEFASMLANYAKAMGKFEAADEGALDSMSDANTVSDWAEANVAWAVENGVMGNGGFVAGHSNITRAEVAAMAVNYQPEAL